MRPANSHVKSPCAHGPKYSKRNYTGERLPDRFAVPIHGGADLQVYQIKIVLIVEIGDRVGVAERTEGVGRGTGLDRAVVLFPPLGPLTFGP